MHQAQPIEREIGIDWYASDAPGIGGRLKSEPADFRVTEIEGIDPIPLDSDEDAYPHLVVRATLHQWDTFDFASRMARELGIHRGAIEWAGTKDKHAITSQLFSIKGVRPAALPELPDVDIEVIGRFGRGLHFGDLIGNEFAVRIRDANNGGRCDRITDELTAFGNGEVAVPNFFGQQRFGSKRPITHKVGFAILSGDWEGAVLAYVSSSSDREPPATQDAREYIAETHDWTGGLQRLPSGLGHERRLLESLRDADVDGEEKFRNALERLPHQLRQLFVHAAQAYIFNRVVSERRHRDIPLAEAIEGDLVCFATTDERIGTVPDTSRTQRVRADRVDTVNRHVRNGRAFVTAPLVGSETDPGSGIPGDIVAGVLDELGISRSDFALPDPYESTGTVRPILVRPDPDIDREPLTFTFALPSGAYATVVMREYLKVDPDAMS